MKISYATAASALLGTAVAGKPGKSERPNIVFVLTDDQDASMNSIDHMPFVNKHIVNHGTTFEKHYCTIAICCPSRVSLWTGRAAHNTNITDVAPPFGGYPRFIEEGYNDKHLAYWMQQAGYNTYYAGKLYNSQTMENYNSPYMMGYTQSEFLLDPLTYMYYGFASTRNGQDPVVRNETYNTDFLADVTYEFLDEAIKDEENPFFITVAPIAPHTETHMNENPFLTRFPDPVSAPRHEHLFKDYKIPRTPNFNPDKPSGVHWIANLTQLTEDDLEYNDEFQRKRLRSLMAVDEMVDGIVQRLEAADLMDNTYIIYSSDNGFHVGQHRMPPGKGCGLETDINVPLVIRGPNVPAGVKRQFPTSHTDLAPTIMKMAGLPIGCRDFDGSPIDLVNVPEKASEHINIEYWGFAAGEGRYSHDAEGHPIYANTTYKGLRIETEDYGYYYSVWCNNEVELYDMKKDPYQISNLMVQSTYENPGASASLEQLVNRLDALLMVLKRCKNDSCREPWKTLHPDGSVTTLKEALDAQYDEFYATQPKISFTACAPGQLLRFEGPMEVIPYSGHGNGAMSSM